MICIIASDQSEHNWECQNENEPQSIHFKLNLSAIIMKLIENGYTDFYMNCEYGIPLWVAEQICALKIYSSIGLHIVMPYEEQCENWSEELRDRYYAVHEQADEILNPFPHFSIDSYERVDRFMVNCSGFVLVFAQEDSPCCIRDYAIKSKVATKQITIESWDFPGK